MQKYGFDDARNVLERASARETAARVAAGALAKALLGQLGTTIISHVIQMGPVRASTDHRPTPADLDAVDTSEVRCFDPSSEAAMIDAIKAAAKEGDSLGGVLEVLGYGVTPGLGSHVHWDRRIDALLAQALMSIQAMKGVEIGDGFEVAGLPGSRAHDEIVWNAQESSYDRTSTRAGGVEGGMTTGGLLVAHVAMKPLASLNRPVLQTVDTATKEATVSFKERTDVTAVPAAGVVAETMVALVLASEAHAEVRRRLARRAPPQPPRVPRLAPMSPTMRGSRAVSRAKSTQRRGWGRRRIVTSGHLVLIGLMGAGKSTVGAAVRGAARASVRGHRRARRAARAT